MSFAGGARADHIPQPRCARSLGTGRSESAVRIRDPFAQALDHRYALERKIGALPDWKGRKLFIVHALAFPYATIHQLALAPDAERGILIDRHDIADLPAALGRVIGYHRGARDRRPGIAVSVLARFTPTSLTTQQYDESIRRLEESGDFPPDGLDYHVCFGSEGNLRVSEIWDSQEQIDAFGERLMPVLADIGIEPGEPEFLEIHNIVRR